MKFKLSVIAASILLSANAAAETNPFTGTRIETEQTKAQLELQQEKNKLAKENLEAKRIEFQIKHSDKVMTADLKKILSPPGAAGVSMPGFPDDGALPKPKSKTAAKPVPKPAPDPAAGMMEAMVGMFGEALSGAPGAGMGRKSMPVSFAPKLVAVMDNGRERVAVIESGGEATTVAVGESMGIGVVTEIGDDMVVVGGKNLYLDKAVVASNNPDAHDPASLTGGKSPSGSPSSPVPPGAIYPPGFQPGVQIR